MKTNISVIILNYNGLEDTKVCLSSLLKSKYKQFSVLVIDNGSSKNEAKILEREFPNPKIKFVRFNKNMGFAEGVNRAISKAKSNYILLLNNDTKIDSKCISELVKTAQKDKNISAVTAKVLSFDNPKYFEYAGAAGGYLDKLGYPYARGRIGFYLEKDTGQYDSEVDVLWGSGTCLLLRKDGLPKKEVFPKDFFFYHEETDLCFRLNRMGKRVVFCPKAIVFHKGGATSKKNMEERIFYTHRNNLFLITRNMSFPKLVWVLPLRLILDLFSSFYYITKGNPGLIFPLFFAILNFIYKFPFIIRRRMSDNIGQQNKIRLSPFCIYWDYFVMKKVKYSEIFSKQN